MYKVKKVIIDLVVEGRYHINLFELQKMVPIFSTQKLIISYPENNNSVDFERISA